MRKLLLTGLALSVTLLSVAQNRPTSLDQIKERLRQSGNLKASPVQDVVAGNELPVNRNHATVRNHVSNLNKSSAAQVIVGTTTYDLQSNGSVQNRIYKKNGAVGASWTMSSDVAGTYADRGTGYNYYDGSMWMPNPTGKIETDRRGWPSLLQLANGSEVVVSHAGVTTSTATNIRSGAGSGSWTQTATPDFPGGEKTLWVRTAAGGPDGNTVHMIDVSYPTGNGGALVNGLDGALNYSRSLDGGVTWDIVRAGLPGATDQEYIGFRADGYAMDAKDNIVTITSGNISDDWCMWKSTDNGATWTKTILIDFPFTKYDGTTQITDVDGDGVADTLLTTDGAYATLIDNNGLIHCFGGAMLVLDNDPATNIGLFLSTDGLLYWNETFGNNEPVVIATAPDLDGDGIAASFAADLGGRFGNDGICSMPSVGVDANNNIYVSYCPLIEGTDSGNPSPLAFSYRNVYLMASMDGGATWGQAINVSDSPFDEAVFCAMAKNVDNCVSLLWQQDGSPGYSVPPNGEHPIGNNDMVYDCVDVNLLLGVSENNLASGVSVSVYPNPVSRILTLTYTAEKPVQVEIEIRNVMGQVVGSFNRNMLNAGSQNFNLDVSRYSNGVYTVNTIIGDKVFASKFIKN
jgi:hypothetical protein